MSPEKYSNLVTVTVAFSFSHVLNSRVTDGQTGPYQNFCEILEGPIFRYLSFFLTYGSWLCSLHKINQASQELGVVFYTQTKLV